MIETMAGHNRWENIRRSTPEQVEEHRRWAKVANGASLAELRALKGKTQVEVGKALDVSQVQAGRIEKGGDEMQLSTIRRYLDAIGMDLDGVLARDREHEDRVVILVFPRGSTGTAPETPKPRARRRAAKATR